MVLYCAVTFGLATLAFGLRYLLLQDAAKSRLSKAQEYVPPVEVSNASSSLRFIWRLMVENDGFTFVPSVEATGWGCCSE